MKLFIAIYEYQERSMEFFSRARIYIICMGGEGMGFADCVGGMGSSESGAFEMQCAGYFHQLAALHLFYLIAVNRLVLKNAVV